MNIALNTIHLADCVESMNALPEGSVDLSFADPPFNIGYDYDVYEDKVGYHEYLDWSRRWITAVDRVLKPDGTFWLAIGDEYAAELKLLSQEIGFHCRSWVVWYYTFGVNCKTKFTRSHAHLFHFVKDPQNFTFRDEDLDNRVPSARELVYNDKRANPLGRLPDDTWIIRPAEAIGELTPDDDRTFVLRPQDLEASFKADEDTWYIPRVAGTFKERAGFHGCQMPEQLLGRIIRTCSQDRDVVLDPFSGSATTLAVAKKLGRKFIGFDISEDYVNFGRQRLSAIRVGDRLDGSQEPTKSAPPTATARRTASRRKGPSTDERLVREKQYDQVQLKLTRTGIVEAYKAMHDGFSADRVIADPELNTQFIENCEKYCPVGDVFTWNWLLLQIRKSGNLIGVPTTRRTKFSWDDADPYTFASEIALQQLISNELATSLDEILCDPVLVRQFDEIASALAPGFSELEYRWAALAIRKQADAARGEGNVLFPPSRWGKQVPLLELKIRDIPKSSGLYVYSKPGRSKSRRLYAGETLDLKRRLREDKRQSAEWTRFNADIQVQILSLDTSGAKKLAWQSCLVQGGRTNEKAPLLNYSKLGSA